MNTTPTFTKSFVFVFVSPQFYIFSVFTTRSFLFYFIRFQFLSHFVLARSTPSSPPIQATLLFKFRTLQFYTLFFYLLSSEPTPSSSISVHSSHRLVNLLFFSVPLC